jgi:hypothetical protein
LFIKPENLSKTELVEKFKELSSSKSLENLKYNKVENKKSIIDLFKFIYAILLWRIFNKINIFKSIKFYIL